MAMNSVEKDWWRRQQEPPTRAFEQIQEWLVVHVARELERDASQIDVNQPLRRFGLDSLAAAGLSGELELWLGRELPGEFLNDFPTIQAIARHLARGTVDSAVPAPPQRPTAGDQPQIGCREWTKSQRVTQFFLAIMVRVVYRLRVEGLENIPREGAFILAANHLHIFDAPIVFSFMPRRVVTFVSDHMQRVPCVNWFMNHMSSAIYVSRGDGDQQALASALSVLQSGGALALAPEGKISKTGGLLQGHAGIAHLATLSGAPVIPIALHGQERLRPWRSRVHVRVGLPVKLPMGKATARQLDAYRDEVMIALARMLPEEYRGVYRERV